MIQAQKSKKRSIVLFFISFATMLSAAGVFSWYYYSHKQQLVVAAYNKVRDYHDIITLFELERFWLTSTPDYSPYYMLEYMTPNKEFQYRGALHINVARLNEKFVGFNAFYMLDRQIGMILFLAIQPEMRSKGYGKTLIKSAIEGLKQLGAQKIHIVTRLINYPARKVYTGLGFKEILQDEDGCIYYEYTK